MLSIKSNIHSVELFSVERKKDTKPEEKGKKLKANIYLETISLNKLPRWLRW